MKDRIKGGLADGLPDSRFNKKQLKRGTDVELEHTRSRKIAKEIAKDHLVEDPLYYQKLSRIEKNPAKPTLLASSTNESGIKEMIAKYWYTRPERISLKPIGKDLWQVCQGDKVMSDKDGSFLVEIKKGRYRFIFQEGGPMKNPRGKPGKIVEYEILDIGVEHGQYFQGLGTAFTEWDEAVVGVGHSYKSALEDAFDQISHHSEHRPTKEIEREWDKEAEKADDTDMVLKVLEREAPNEKASVHYINEQGLTFPPQDFETIEEARERVEEVLKQNSKYQIDEVGEDDFEITNDNWPSNRRIWIETNEDEREEFFDQDHELYYYVGIRYKVE